MEQEVLIMGLAVFGAAALQAATGIGFGVVAGPILLTMLNSGAAIQISIILNLLIAIVLAPSLRGSVNPKLLSKFLVGTLIGMPLGLYVFLSVDIPKLKLLAGLAVVLSVFFVLRSIYSTRRVEGPAPAGRGPVPIGVLSGLMGGSMAMPGPIPAAWMSASGYDKNTVRATILMLVVFSYAGALLLQVSLAGIAADTLWSSAMLAPATIGGIFFGRMLTALISERTFRWLVVVTLVLTAALLFSSVR